MSVADGKLEIWLPGGPSPHLTGLTFREMQSVGSLCHISGTCFPGVILFLRHTSGLRKLPVFWEALLDLSRDYIVGSPGLPAVIFPSRCKRGWSRIQIYSEHPTKQRKIWRYGGSNATPLEKNAYTSLHLTSEAFSNQGPDHPFWASR